MAPPRVRRSKDPWTPGEDAWLAKHYLSNTMAELKAHLRRSEAAITRRAKALGLAGGKPRGRRPLPDLHLPERALEAYVLNQLQGLSLADTALEMELGFSRVRKLVTRFAIAAALDPRRMAEAEAAAGLRPRRKAKKRGQASE